MRAPAPAENGAVLSPTLRGRLLQTARASIEHGLTTGRPLEPLRQQWPAEAWVARATFVTLETPDGALRGCRGVLEPVRPLPRDVAVNAFDTAFDDPRFPPVRTGELAGLRLSLSVLSPRESIAAADPDTLAQLLTPGIDGLLLEAGPYRATFLPKVWEQLPEPADFLAQLWRKAGLAPGSWPAGIRFWRYGAEAFGEA
ncbi:MAG: AmmeMemoRadiSam system protein A [Pseudomonadales bacterium]|nr:AmmeMemoRadiSam system protein A [Pseudomonadales bacterium]